ncbi:uncharacterized protein LOC8258769 isoform X2 [Ricinus communis]|uniref:uncharacterized protein LOC8258769 isoform X2 n=1 Tax=Ricinus communis TaxID=3988 RepID=UPI00201A5719|nr:uncharacterized protein LOC8258769 isoform X2 [Ricinus communis]
MLLKNLMEEKQLDFNQPLLSVRRFSSTVSTIEADNKKKTENAFSKVPPLPKYKSELKSGPVRNPGTVPFVWERSPGKPKCEIKPQTVALQQPPMIPKLPPGRMLNVERQGLNKAPGGTAAGQCEARNGLLGSYGFSSSDRNVIKEESSREKMEKTDMSGSEDDETYVDALDTLSRSESFFLNCSISGVSGLDGPDMKPSGTFSTDPQTRDFMMGRFLPAAKAMASETPQHSTKKQPAAQEQPRQIKKTLGVEKYHPFNECRRQSDMPHCSQCSGVKEIEQEDDDYNYEGPDNSSPKVCGLFPRLCLQNSFCLLSPVPGMRKQVQLPISLSHMTKVKPSYAACCTETMNEHDKDAVNKRGSVNALQAKGIVEDKIELKSESNKKACRNDYQKLDGSYLYKRLQGNGTSPYHDKFSQSAVSEEKGFLGVPEKPKNSGARGFNAHAKGGKNFRELLANERNEWESAPASSLVEKTLYIDSVQMIKPQTSNSSSPDTKDLINCRRDDQDKEIDGTATFDSSFQDIKNANSAYPKVNVLPESLDPTDSSLLSLSDKSMHDAQMPLVHLRHDQDLMAISVTPTSPKVYGDGKIDLESQLGKILSNLESSIQDPIKMTRENVADNGKTDLKSQLCTELGDQETPDSCYTLHPLPPPLPKSPSESWLKRTLPAVSSKHTSLKSFPGMHAYPVVQAPKVQSPDLKWETIVKTSNVQCGHLRFSEEDGTAKWC